MSDDRRYTDPATTRLPHVRYDDPRHNPIAFLPADEVPVGRVDFAGAMDWARPPDHPTFTTDDGSVYERPDPDEFDCFDDVDSTTIVDDGGPDD